MKKIIITIIFLVLMPLCIQAYSDLPYFNIPIGAKSSALGGAFSAMSGEIESLWYNPAGISTIKNVQIMLSHVSWVGDINMEYFLLGIPLTDFMAMGIAVNYSYTADRLVDEFGSDYGQFSNSNLIIEGGYAVSFGIVDAGLIVKITNEVFDVPFTAGSSGGNVSVTQVSSGILGDAGVLVHFFDDIFNAAITVQNVLGILKDDNTGVERQAPLIFKCGFAEKNFIKGLLFVQEFRYNCSESEGFFALGIQDEIKIENFNIAVRGGYETQRNNLGGLSGFTAGAGLNYKNIKFDYAFVPYDFAGNAHRFTLILSF